MKFIEFLGNEYARMAMLCACIGVLCMVFLWISFDMSADEFVGMARVLMTLGAIFFLFLTFVTVHNTWGELGVRS